MVLLKVLALGVCLVSAAPPADRSYSIKGGQGHSDTFRPRFPGVEVRKEGSDGDLLLLKTPLVLEPNPDKPVFSSKPPGAQDEPDATLVQKRGGVDKFPLEKMYISHDDDNGGIVRDVIETPVIEKTIIKQCDCEKHIEEKHLEEEFDLKLSKENPEESQYEISVVPGKPDFTVHDSKEDPYDVPVNPEFGLPPSEEPAVPDVSKEDPYDVPVNPEFGLPPSEEPAVPVEDKTPDETPASEPATPLDQPKFPTPDAKVPEEIPVNSDDQTKEASELQPEYDYGNPQVPVKEPEFEVVPEQPDVPVVSGEPVEPVESDTKPVYQEKIPTDHVPEYPKGPYPEIPENTETREPAVYPQHPVDGHKVLVKDIPLGPNPNETPSYSEAPTIEEQESQSSEDSPKLPVDVSENPKVPADEPEYPKVAVDVPEDPKVSVDVPESPKVPADVPESPKVPIDVPESPKVPVDVPQVSVDVPENPQVPVDVPKYPKVPVYESENPKLPVDVPESPNVPVYESENPKVPVKPVPENPQLPVDVPENPKYPVDSPENPTVVGVDVKPEDLPVVPVDKPIPIDTPAIVPGPVENPIQPEPSGSGLKPTVTPTLGVVCDEIGLRKFLYLLNKAGYKDLLNRKRPLTIFAPSDAAWNSLPLAVLNRLQRDRGFLRRVLRYHMIDGLEGDVVRRDYYCPSMQQGSGLFLNSFGKTMYVNGIAALTSPVRPVNGALYVLPKVLFPFPPNNLAEAIQTTGTFTRFYTLAAEAGILDGELSGRGPFTLFAPTDEAFSKLPPKTIEWLSWDKEALRSLLLKHLVPGTYYSTFLGEKDGGHLKSISGEDIELKNDVYKDEYLVNGAHLLAHDLTARNGVLHAVDEVLFLDTLSPKPFVRPPLKSVYG